MIFPSEVVNYVIWFIMVFVGIYVPNCFISENLSIMDGSGMDGSDRIVGIEVFHF